MITAVDGFPTTNDRVRPRRLEVLADNWYVLRNAVFDYRHRDGTWSTQEREAYDRGNGATLLLFDPRRRTVVLTRQFRVPAYLNGHHDGVLIEAPAGLLEHDDPETAIRREVEEETGYRVKLRRLLTVESFRELVARPDGPVDHQTIAIVYAAEVVGGELRDEIGGSTDTAAWVPLADVPRLVRGGLVDVGLAVAGHLPAGADGAVR